MNYETCAKQILNVLGKENIISVTHCMTRLRFIMKDGYEVDDEQIKHIPGVMGVMRKGGQYQIIIGNEVGKCYQHIQKIGGFSTPAAGAETARKKGWKDFVNGIFDYISSSMSSLIPALIGGGMIKVLLIVLPMLHILDVDSSTYAFLAFFGDAPFYFMPMMLAYAASQKMHVTPMLAVTVAGILLHPNFAAMIAAGDPMTLFGLPVTGVSYSSTVIPILIMVWLMSYIEKAFQKIVPAIFKSFLTPLLIMIVSGAIAVIAVGPLGSFAGTWLYNGIMWVQQYAGWLAMALVVAFMPMIVMTGMHWALAVFALVASQQNPDTLLLPAMLVSNLAQGVACIVVGLRARNKELKTTAFSSGVLALLAGVTEPAMYGVTLKLKKPMLATMISGGIVGIFVGLFNLKSFTFAVPSLLSLPQFVSETGGDNFMHALMVAGMIIALTAIATWGLGFQEEEEAKEDITEVVENDVTPGFHDPKKLLSPLSGRVVPLSEVPDDTFAKEIMGKGIAIIPEVGEVVAPFDGRVEALFPTLHAIGLKSESGMEVLIHIGIDTMNLNGKYFEAMVSPGDRVHAGDVLVKFSIEDIKQAGYETITPVIITNSNDYIDVIAKDITKAQQLDPVLIVM